MITQIRKIFIFAFLVFFSFNAYSFWIWSPKTQKWKNPKYSPLATPFLQFKEAEKYFNEKLYKEAHREFKKLLINYPDSKEAAEAQYYLGRCLEEMNQPYAAFLEYQKVIESYPNSKRINEIVEREYNIGEYFLNREPKKWLGVSLYDLVEHPSIEILRKIVDKTPYSPCAPKAQYKLGLLFMQLGRYEEAKDAFQKVIDSYPENK
jgi:TolA-binding protein